MLESKSSLGVFRGAIKVTFCGVTARILGFGLPSDFGLRICPYELNAALLGR